MLYQDKSGNPGNNGSRICLDKSLRFEFVLQLKVLYIYRGEMNYMLLKINMFLKNPWVVATGMLFPHFLRPGSITYMYT
jgi:hypothetical protein